MCARRGWFVADSRSTQDDTIADAQSFSAQDPTSLFELNEKERSRVAFDIHDGPSQSISSALLQLRLLGDAEGEELREGLRVVEACLLETVDDLYNLIEQLRGRALDCTGLVAKVETHVQYYSERTGIPVAVSVDADGEVSALSESAQIAVFRIVQEALTNVARHSEATQATVWLGAANGRIACVIADNGKGFLPDAPRPAATSRSGRGIFGMQERARLLGGECRFSSAPGQGCEVAIDIPIWRG
jgi:signal transduction histidine kinase